MDTFNLEQIFSYARDSIRGLPDTLMAIPGTLAIDRRADVPPESVKYEPLPGAMRKPRGKRVRSGPVLLHLMPSRSSLNPFGLTVSPPQGELCRPASGHGLDA